MRQCRGKRVDSGGWVKGGYVEWDSESYIIPKGCSLKRCGTKTNEHIVSAYKVIPETVGQLTGLKDKNGVEIFEEDTIRGGQLGENCVVKWDVSCGRWIAYSEKYKVLGHKFKMFEVSGNIHTEE